MRGATWTVGHRLACAVVVTAAVASSSPAFAEPVSLSGVSFSLPPDLVSQGKQEAPLAFSWANASDSVQVTVSSIPADGRGNINAVKQFEKPEASRWITDAFMADNVKTLGRALRAECTYTDVPVSRDLDRPAIQVQVDVTCAMAARPVQLRWRLIAVATRISTVVICVSSLERPASDAEADAITAGIWSTLKVDKGLGASRIQPTAEAMKVLVPFFVNLLFALALGALLTLLLLKVRLRPLPALVVAQVLVVSLRAGMEIERYGMWMESGRDVLNAIIVFYALRGWARRYWAKRNPTPPPQPDGTTPSTIEQLVRPTMAQRIAEGARITGYLVSAVAILSVWAFIGSGLLALATAMSAVTLPVLVVVMIGAFVVSRFKTKR